MQQIMKDEKMREAADAIRNEVGHLMGDVGRLRERTLKLQQHFNQANRRRPPHSGVVGEGRAAGFEYRESRLRCRATSRGRTIRRCCDAQAGSGRVSAFSQASDIRAGDDRQKRQTCGEQRDAARPSFWEA